MNKFKSVSLSLSNQEREREDIRTIKHYQKPLTQLQYLLSSVHIRTLVKGRQRDSVYTFVNSDVADLSSRRSNIEMNVLRRGNSIFSKRVVPLQTSHLLEIDATMKAESQLSTDTLKHLCEQGAVRSQSLSSI